MRSIPVTEWAFDLNPITEADELNEYRMSNKVYPPSAAPEATREFRMMKLKDFDCLLQPSSFVIRPARYALKQIGD